MTSESPARALLVVDMISGFRFEHGEQPAIHTDHAVANLAALKRRFVQDGQPVI